MQAFTARVCDGAIVPEDGMNLPGGTTVIETDRRQGPFTCSLMSHSR